MQPRSIKSVGIIGAGTIGQAMARAGGRAQASFGPDAIRHLREPAS